RVAVRRRGRADRGPVAAPAGLAVRDDPPDRPHRADDDAGDHRVPAASPLGRPRRRRPAPAERDHHGRTDRRWRPVARDDRARLRGSGGWQAVRAGGPPDGGEGRAGELPAPEGTARRRLTRALAPRSWTFGAALRWGGGR